MSLLLSSSSSFLDIYTTHIFIEEIGSEFEANKRIRDIIEKRGYRRELVTEAILVIVIAFLDSTRLYTTFLLIGLVIFMVRGLAAVHNLQVIVEYRTVGINSFKDWVRLERQAFQNTSWMNRASYALQNLVLALVCIIVYVMLLSVDSPFVVLSRYFVFGLVCLFLVKAQLSLRYISPQKTTKKDQSTEFPEQNED